VEDIAEKNGAIEFEYPPGVVRQGTLTAMQFVDCQS